MLTYQLTILTPDGKIFDNPVEELMAPGAAGMFGVLAQHASMVAALNKGVLKIKQNSTANIVGVLIASIGFKSFNESINDICTTLE